MDSIRDSINRLASKIFKYSGLAPYESAAVVWIIIVGIRRLYKAFIASRSSRSLKSNTYAVVADEKSSTSKDEQTSLQVEEITAKVRGRRFAQTEGSDNENEIDMSIIGTLQFYIPAALISLHHLTTFAVDKNNNSIIPPPQQFMRAYLGIFGLLPLVDIIVPNDWTNPTKEQQVSTDNRLLFRLPLYAWTAVELLSTLNAYKIALGSDSKLGTGSKISVFLVMALFNGAFGITCAHELIHKRPMLEQLLGYWLLCNVNYMHWGEEHVTGHHDNVATENDPATAKYGESLYHFVPRCMYGTVMHSIEIEIQRLKESGYQGNPWLTLNNRMYWWLAAPFCWSVFLAKYTGNWKSIPIFYGTSILSASLLEIVNFVEHWGLERKKLDNGKYEPVDPTHSWNAPNRISNAVLWKLQRHSDHHTFASRPYHLLRNFKESPQLPTGYPGMVVLSFFPPIYEYVMAPLTDAYRNRSKYLAIIDKDPDNETSLMEFRQAQMLCEKADSAAKVKTFAFGILFLGAAIKAFPKCADYLANLD